ncbi:hypothetical protein [Thaumasiovibrio subtropicus]|uniref:hypothetical protein n=1 Tax=Thaumasiovibrio subtropicus TaxID=1891207 RepID=UPI000B35FB3B|nr:hypothetical protein [Thaumasiovibrio subtropicus]
MKKLFWWNLTVQEKMKRSFVLTPITGILLFLLLNDADLSGLKISAIVAIGMMLMLLQGLYYKRKLTKNNVQ